MKYEPGLKTDWDKKKSMLKQKFGVLTNDDLSFEKWEKDEMINHLQVRLEESKEMIYKFIANL